MTDYKKLVEALRCKRDDCEGCGLAFFDKDEGWMCQYAAKDDDAADAIERITAMYEKAEMDATNLTGKLAQAEAEVERLKDSNDELREAQTYIDHYGDKWRTSAKDVPTSAYNHGYMDGKNEAEQALEPKRGEWEREMDVNDEPFYQCSVCGECFDFNRDSTHEVFKYCPNCGAKMEVQDD